MAEPRRSNHAASAIAVALALACALSAGCGKSTPAADTPTTDVAAAGAPAVPSATAADPRTAPPPAERSSPSSSQDPPGAGSATATAPPAHPRPRGIPPAHPVPAAFRPAPGAPSDAEVRSELAQMAAIQRQEYVQRLSAAAANLAGLLPWSLEPKSGTQVSVASVFTDYGLGLACGGLLGRDQLGVAHKTAPCGTLITFTYAGRSITVPVIDRGPYIAGREWDLTGATAAALGFPGLGQIQWSVAR